MKQIVAILLVMALVYYIPFFIPAEENDKTLRIKPTESVTTPSGEKWAILIGIDKYKDEGINPLKYTVKDVEGVYNVITTAQDGFKPDNVILMTPNAANPLHRPTRSNILAILRSWFNLADINDTILLYYSGHGIEREGNAYILPQDAMTADIGMTAIEIEYLKDILRNSKAQKRILILDACHSGAGKDVAASMGKGLVKNIEDSKGMVILASCDINESSYEMNAMEHGAFTYFLIEALKGKADRDKDGELWVSEVNYYVWDNTRKWAAKNALQQTPKYVSAVQGEIVLAKAGPLIPQIQTLSPAQTPTILKPETVASPELPKTIIGKDGAEMMLIPAGEFLMGSPEGEGYDSEHPQHTVYLGAFYIDKYEVTNEQYKKFVDATGHRLPNYEQTIGKITYIQSAMQELYSSEKRDHPVVLVSWKDAEAYCKWAGKRLPTEAEWEKAARGGLEGKKYPWGDEDPTGRANFGLKGTMPVGSYSPNGYGLYNVAGNVYERVADWYKKHYYKESPKDNPKGPGEQRYALIFSDGHTLRGGSWSGGVDGIRVARRFGSGDGGLDMIGFRCSQDIP